MKVANKKIKKSPVILAYECLQLNCKFIENNGNMYLYENKDKTKKLYRVTPGNIRTLLVLMNREFLATDGNIKNVVSYLQGIREKFVSKDVFLHVLVSMMRLFILIQ